VSFGGACGPCCGRLGHWRGRNRLGVSWDTSGAPGGTEKMEDDAWEIEAMGKGGPPGKPDRRADAKFGTQISEPPDLAYTQHQRPRRRHRQRPRARWRDHRVQLEPGHRQVGFDDSALVEMAMLTPASTTWSSRLTSSEVSTPTVSSDRPPSSSERSCRSSLAETALPRLSPVPERRPPSPSPSCSE